MTLDHLKAVERGCEQMVAEVAAQLAEVNENLLALGNVVSGDFAETPK